MGKKKILSGENVLEFYAFWGTKAEAGKDSFFFPHLQINDVLNDIIFCIFKKSTYLGVDNKK